MRSVLLLKATGLARPSLLRGERIAARLGWLMPATYKPVEARDVATALVRLAAEDREGARVVESRELRLSYAR